MQPVSSAALVDGRGCGDRGGGHDRVPGRYGVFRTAALFLYKQLTFSASFVENARFLSDGQARSLPFSVAGERPRQAFTTSIDSESAIGHPQAR